jgi:hypothetical protein
VLAENTAPSFLISALDGEWLASRPGRFTSEEIAHGIHLIGGWENPVWTLWSTDKTFVPAGNRAPAVKSVARRYIERTIPSPTTVFYKMYFQLFDRLCGLVVRVPGYRFRGLGSIPGATRFSEK